MGCRACAVGCNIVKKGWEPTVKAARLRFWLVFAWPISFFLLFLCSFPCLLPSYGATVLFIRYHTMHTRERGATALICRYLSSTADVPFFSHTKTACDCMRTEPDRTGPGLC